MGSNLPCSEHSRLDCWYCYPTVGNGGIAPRSGQAFPPEDEQVNSPPHYNQGDIECIDAIKAALGPYFRWYLMGNMLKYLWRHPYKGEPTQDLSKMRWYEDKLEEELKLEGPWPAAKVPSPNFNRTYLRRNEDRSETTYGTNDPGIIIDDHGYIVD